MAKKERRTQSRSKVLYGASTSGTDKQAARRCVVRNLSDGGALVEYRGVSLKPTEELSVSINCKRAAYQARVVWWHDNVAGLAFSKDAPRTTGPDAEIQEQLRVARKNNYQLKRRVRQLLGQD